MTGWGKGGRDHLDLGDWNAACSMCGRKRKASEMVRNWQGQFRCPEHNEARHPQEYVRPVPDVQTPPWVQPPCDEFAGVCFPLDISGVTDYAVADCAICEYVSPFAGISLIGSVGYTVQIFLTSGTSWAVPADWNSANNTIECVGGGGGGKTGTSVPAGGGGGGAYSKAENLFLSGTVAYSVGAAGVRGAVATAGGDTYFNGTSLATSNVGAAGGSPGQTLTGGAGGSAALGIGTTKYSGGTGGDGGGFDPCGGGGGAAGPSGAGGRGGEGGPTFSFVGGGGGGANGGTIGQSGDAGGIGGIVGGGNGGDSANGTVGTADTAFDATHGCGGGGGGGGRFSLGNDGGAGGNYGGGGGGGNVGGNGGAGLIVITYEPLAL